MCYKLVFLFVLIKSCLAFQSVFKSASDRFLEESNNVSHLGMCDTWKSLDGVTKATGSASFYTLKETSPAATFAELFVTGMTMDGSKYTGQIIAHLHTGKCNSESAGHYKNTPTDEVMESNELWFYITLDNGDAISRTAAEFSLVSKAASSIVIHSPVDNTKMFCCDLTHDGSGNASCDSFAPMSGVTDTISTSRATVMYWEMSRPIAKGEINVQLIGSISKDIVLTSHLHEKACSDENGGGHFKYNTTAIPDPTNSDRNEIWWKTVTSGGSGFGTIEFDSVVTKTAGYGYVDPDDAKSIVLHANGVKAVCCDLSYSKYTPQKMVYSTPTTMNGKCEKWETLSTESAATGSVNVVTKYRENTFGTLTVTKMEVEAGVPFTGQAMAHLHEKDCASGGGGHYKDLTTKNIDEPNEVWWYMTINKGSAVSRAGAPFILREESAKSVVIHSPVDNSKMFCCDLTFTTSGTSKIATCINGFIGLNDVNNIIEATVTLESGSDTAVAFGVIDVTLSGIGLSSVNADAPVKTHLHDEACTDNGGGHFKYDYSIPGAEAANELWWWFPTNSEGKGKTASAGSGWTSPVLAKSVVVHHPVSSDKLVCCDLIWDSHVAYTPTDLTTEDSTDDDGEDTNANLSYRKYLPPIISSAAFLVCLLLGVILVALIRSRSSESQYSSSSVVF
jgi:hypothetical protein